MASELTRGSEKLHQSVVEKLTQRMVTTEGDMRRALEQFGAFDPLVTRLREQFRRDKARLILAEKALARIQNRKRGRDDGRTR